MKLLVFGATGPTGLEIVKRSAIPVILANNDTFSIAERITKLTIKIRSMDQSKITTVKQLIKEYVDIEMLMDKTLKTMS